MMQTDPNKTHICVACVLVVRAEDKTAKQRSCVIVKTNFHMVMTIVQIATDFTSHKQDRHIIIDKKKKICKKI